MPHFVIDCSENITEFKSPQEIMQAVYNAADSSGLFDLGDIKVRINTFQHFLLGEGKKDFIHVFGNIMEGRTTAQKADLSKRIVTTLLELFPEVPIVSMNVRDFEQKSYCNRSLIAE